MKKPWFILAIIISAQLYIASCADANSVDENPNFDQQKNVKNPQSNQVLKIPPVAENKKQNPQVTKKTTNSPNAEEYRIPVQVTVQYDSNEKQIEKQQRQFQNQHIEEIQENLHSWVSAELENLEQRAQFYIGQQFNLPIQTGGQYKVRWNPQKRTVFHIQVYVLIMDQNGDISSPQNPQEDENILITVSADGRPSKKLGNVYINQVFTIDFTRADYYEITFINNYDYTVVLTVDLQGQRKILQAGVDDDQFLNSRNKMVQMLQQMQQTEIRRQNRQKWEWGFKDKQLKHQQQMLALTGVELFVIIVTAIVQMYCIKSLLDNRSIV